MAPGQPAREPIPPSIVVCVERPFGFHTLTGWFWRRSPMPWTIGHVCRMQLLNLGLLGRCSVQNMELCAPAQLDLLAPGTDCSDALCDGDRGEVGEPMGACEECGVYIKCCDVVAFCFACVQFCARCLTRIV